MSKTFSRWLSVIPVRYSLARLINQTRVHQKIKYHKIIVSTWYRYRYRYQNNSAACSEMIKNAKAPSRGRVAMPCNAMLAQNATKKYCQKCPAGYRTHKHMRFKTHLLQERFTRRGSWGRPGRRATRSGRCRPGARSRRRRSGR